MHDTKRRIIDGIIAVEEGYVDHPLDSGGPTMYGVTQEVARRYGYEGDMRDLPLSVAFEIFEVKYWGSVCGDRLLGISEAVIEEVVDTGVNMGVGTASRILQRALNVLNVSEGLYDDLLVDGHVGHLTLTALEGYLNSGRSETVLVRALECLQGARYIELAENYPKNEAFVYGWLKKRVGL